MRLLWRHLPLYLVLFLGRALLCAEGTPDGDGQGTLSTLKRLSLEELSDIKVTSATKAPQQLSRVPMAIFVITADEIRRAGVTNIPEALRLAPGVDVARIEGSKWAVGVRGFASRFARSVLVLIDGRTVYTTLFAGTYWEVQDTLLEDVDHIEVIRGPGGTIWGPNAVNGVINIITKHSSQSQGVLVTAGGGNETQGLAQFRYGGARGSRFHYRIYGKAFTRGPQYHHDLRNYDDWRSSQAGFRADWTRSDHDFVTLQGDLYKQEAGHRLSVHSYTPPFLRRVEQNADLSGGNLMGRWTRSLSNGSTLQIQTFYDHTGRFEASLGERRDTFDLDFNIRGPEASLHRFSWGAGIRTSRGAAEEVTTGIILDPWTRTDYLLTGFIQDEIALNEQVSLTIGTKLLRTNFADFEYEPSARMLWAPSKSISAWAAVTRAVRTPSRLERDAFVSIFVNTRPDGIPAFGRFNANRQFTSETLTGYELGYRQLLVGDLYVDFASYFNQYEDLNSQEITGSAFIETTPQPTHLLLPVQIRNGLYGTSNGFEIAPEWRPAEIYRLRGSYSYQVIALNKYENSQDVGSAPVFERSSPRHKAVVQSSFNLPKGLELDLTYRYVSSLAAQNIPQYSTGDARLGWRIRPNVDISLIGRNLLQPNHIEFTNEAGIAVGIRRAAFVRLTWTQ